MLAISHSFLKLILFTLERHMCYVKFISYARLASGSVRFLFAHISCCFYLEFNFNNLGITFPLRKKCQELWNDHFGVKYLILLATDADSHTCTLVFLQALKEMLCGSGQQATDTHTQPSLNRDLSHGALHSAPCPSPSLNLWITLCCSMKIATGIKI